MTLETIGDIAAILTASFAAAAWVQFQWERRQRRIRLERHLKHSLGSFRGAATIPELMADLAMTEQAILDAAFRSKVIRRGHRLDEASGRTVAVEFEYDSLPTGPF